MMVPFTVKGGCPFAKRTMFTRKERRAPMEALERRVFLAAHYVAQDLAFWRPTTNTYSIDYGNTGNVDDQHSIGVAGDIPVAGDFFGSSQADMAVFRPGTGSNTGQWFVDQYNFGSLPTSPKYNQGGSSGTPVAGDITGNGIADIGTYTSSSGKWHLLTDGGVASNYLFGGASGDVPFLADFNHDGYADLVICHTGTGGEYTWQVAYNQGNGTFAGTWDPTHSYVTVNTSIYFSFGGTGTPSNGSAVVGNGSPFVLEYNGDGIPDVGIFQGSSSGGTWKIDTNVYSTASSTGPTTVNGAADSTYTNSAARSGDTPVNGYFNTFGSVFVDRKNGLASNNGSCNSPVQTVQQALSLVVPNGTVRIAADAAGQAADSTVAVSTKSEITFFGAGKYATHLSPVAGAGDAMDVDDSTDIVLQNLTVAPAFNPSSPNSTAYGLRVRGSTVYLLNMTTAGSSGDGIYADIKTNSSPSSTIDTAITANISQFDSSAMGSGVWLQDGTSFSATACSFNANGTAFIPNQGSTRGTAIGYGLYCNNASTATIAASMLSDNTQSNIITGNASNRPGPTLTVNGQSLIFGSVDGDGLLIEGATNLNLSDSEISQNGTESYQGSVHYDSYSHAALATYNYDVAHGITSYPAPDSLYASGGIKNGTTQVTTGGLNGIEIFKDFNGTATIQGNYFEGNTDTAIFVSGYVGSTTTGWSGSPVQVTGNTVLNNFRGIVLDGATDTVDGQQYFADAVVTGNDVLVNSTSELGGWDRHMAEGMLVSGGGVGHQFVYNSTTHTLTSGDVTIGGATTSLKNTIDGYQDLASNGGYGDYSSIGFVRFSESLPAPNSGWPLVDGDTTSHVNDTTLQSENTFTANTDRPIGGNTH